MMRYFFDIRDGKDLYPDEEGLDLPNQLAAEVEATDALAALARDAADENKRRDVAIEVRSETTPLFHASLVFQSDRAKQ
ncbi:hypothetical protein [Bradyrhizobium sp. CCBAU 51753]|uniref:DUF6894 family protein n=1 Tax=Bradyrhizobium sp. CCBAU 51753 TaxID=1325100 RepID=UPI00188B3053|nr:hypothetical protein [Bradyrhizobium sp. CCBAU 51753]QOZ29837.1 hypothetical protein XH93_21155 [Bradyrhizobium sp. CCBAU 51753]